MAHGRRRKRGFGKFLKKLGKIAKVALPFAKPFLKMAVGIIPGGGTVMGALEMGGKLGAFKALGGAFRKGGLKRLGKMIPGMGLLRQGGRLLSGKRVNLRDLAGGLAPGLNETLALAKQGRNLVQGRRVDFGQVAGALAGPGMGGLSIARFASAATRAPRRRSIFGGTSRTGRIAQTMLGLGDVAGMSDRVASRILGVREADLRRARALAGDTDTGALAGIEYIVEDGDYLSKIAQRLVGNAGRWRELRDANPQKKPWDKNGNFRTLNADEHLTLPASWIAELGLAGDAAPAPGEVVQLPADTIFGSAPPAVAMPADFTLPASLPALPSLPPAVAMPADFTLPASLPTSPPPTVTPILTSGESLPASTTTEPLPAAATAAEPPPAAPSGGGIVPLALGVGAWALGLI
jgi:hypothetical protein